MLVTGHEGFLGSNLVRALAGKCSNIVGVDKVINRPISVLNSVRKQFVSIKADISDFNKIRNIITAKKPHVIFHLAAEAIVGRAKDNPINVFRSNIAGTWNLLESCRNKDFVEGVIVASSDKAYGISNKLPYTEDMPLAGRHPYDASKSCGDIIAQAYWKAYGVPAAVLRCGNIYGPGDFNFSRIIPDAVMCAIRSRTLVIRSDGKYTRDYVFVEDIVNGYIILAEKLKLKKLFGEPFNLSGEMPISVLEVVKAVEKAYGRRIPKPVIQNKAKDEIPHQYLSSRKARNVLGWNCGVLFEDGLKKTIGWYEENYK